MNNEEFARRVESIRVKLYKTAILYLGSESQAQDALDETVYKALCGYHKLRRPEYFDTWITRILINECHNLLRHQNRETPVETLPETEAEALDTLPLKEAIRCLPEELKEVVILRYFSGLTLQETAQLLKIPQGTAVTRQRKALKLLRLELEEEGEA